jgi:hypothetical protein
VAAMWQRCGSHRGQSKSRFTLFKVNKTLTLIGRTWTLSDVTDGWTDETDGRMHRQPWPYSPQLGQSIDQRFQKNKNEEFPLFISSQFLASLSHDQKF